MSGQSPEHNGPDVAVSCDTEIKVGGSSEDVNMEDEKNKMQRAARQSANTFLCLLTSGLML